MPGELDWILFKDKYPENGQLCLCVDKDGTRKTTLRYYYDPDNKHEFKQNTMLHVSYGDLLAWYPIPEIPASELYKGKIKPYAHDIMQFNLKPIFK